MDAFAELYDAWEPEDLDLGGETTGDWPVPESWATDLFRDLGFKLLCHATAGRQSEAWHLNGDEVHFWKRHVHRDVRHELAHVIVWIGHGRPGSPQQWGIGTRPYPAKLADSLERLVEAVEWVLEEKHGSYREIYHLIKGFVPYDKREARLTPQVVVEATRIVNTALPS